MDDNGTTKVLPKQTQPPPPNSIFPIDVDYDIQRFLEDGSKSEEPKIEGAQREEKAPLAEETPPPGAQKAEKMIEGMVRRLNDQCNRYEGGYFIVLYWQQLTVYDGDSKECEILH